MGFKRIVHISDLHIRSGDLQACRFNEYAAQIDKCLAAIGKYECDTTLVVVTGDLFHEKSKLGSGSHTLAQRFFSGLSLVAKETVVIRGNHDYRQDQPNEPDLIKPFFYNVPDNISYLDETGLYQRDDIEIGLVAVQDTLLRGAGSGIIKELPPFPEPSTDDPTVKHSIALFHGSFGGALLQNGTETDTRSNYALDWIKGYSLRLFGDIHVQQVHNAKIQLGNDFTNKGKQDTFTVGSLSLTDKSWGYAGSLIQQNFGESLWGHGFVEWNLETNTAKLIHLPNDFGYVIVTVNLQEEPCVKIRTGRTVQLIPIKTIVKYGWFPNTISLRFSTKLRDSTVNIQALFEQAGIVVKDTGFVEENTVEDTQSPTVTHETKDTLVNDLSNLNSPQTWINYFQDDSNIEDGEWKEWITHPHLLRVPTDVFPPETAKILEKRNTDFAKQVDTYMHSRDERSPIRHFRIHYMEFSWLLCFGADNYINFDTFIKQVALINGNNGSGKSSLLEVICLAIFGESFPSRYNKSFSAAVINQHIPKSETAYTKICFSVNSKKYWLIRSYMPSSSDIKYLRQKTIKLIDAETNEIIKQAACVNPWILENVGKYEHFLMTCIVSQSNDSDFFSMKPAEQKAIIDSLLQLDVCEEFRKILHQSSLDHKYVLTQLSIYESGRNEATKYMSAAKQVNFDDLEQQKRAQLDERTQLEAERVTSKDFYSSIPEKKFQLSLTDYENDKRKFQSLSSQVIEGDMTAAAWKTTRQVLRDQMAVLKTKRYKMTAVGAVGAVAIPFSTLEKHLEALKLERVINGTSSIKLYDAKAHADWISKKKKQQQQQQQQQQDKQDKQDKTLKELEKELRQILKEFENFEEFDESDYKSVSEKVLLGLEKQHNELTQQLNEYEATKNQLSKEIETLKSILTTNIKKSLTQYQASLKALKDAFASEPKAALQSLTEANTCQIILTQQQKELARVTDELTELIKIKFSPTCNACNDNPYRHKREDLESSQTTLQKEISVNQAALQKILPRPYSEMKTIYDNWHNQHSDKVVSLLDSQSREKAVLAEFTDITTKIQDTNDEIEDVGYESQSTVNEYYSLKEKQSNLENEIELAKFSEEEKEWSAAKKASELDIQIRALEEDTAIAYTSEFRATENKLKEADTQIEIHENIIRATNELSEITQICEAYPHWLAVVAIDVRLKPLNQSISLLEATISQGRALQGQLNSAATVAQQLLTFRSLLENRNTMITKLSTAYNKYTDWLYPTKVGPAIEDAVNNVLSSIALPRPISLKFEWDKEHFSWYVRDGKSTPPYEKCSGAQRFFIGLATRFALGRLGASNVINEQIFLDEGFTACDAETMERVPNLLKNLLKELDYLQTVFMVSHLEILKSSAETSISIVRGASSSILHVGERESCPRGIPLLVQDAPTVPVKKRGRPKKADGISVAE